LLSFSVFYDGEQLVLVTGGAGYIGEDWWSSLSFA